MFQNNQLWIAKSGDEKLCIQTQMANRHGLIAGATGTGKTITLKVLAESFSDCGVPVFLADVKGDLAGMCQPGSDNESMQKRIDKFGLHGFGYQAYPTCFWDIFAEEGHALRTTVSTMGPTLLGRLMDLTSTQEDVLAIVFKIADDNGMLLIDTKDLRAMLQYVSEHRGDYADAYGNLTKQSIGTIIRKVIALEEQGGDRFFGEPAVDIRDWMRTDSNGKGFINIMHCVKLINSPDLYATFMLWMLSELFEVLPEAGDTPKPKLIFFFDEAHILFQNAPKALLQKIEQVVKLIRSKGVGIYFITQNPADLPGEVLAQLGNRIQHALRAYTPAEQKAVKAAAQSFRENPAFQTEEVIMEMGIGEALISFLDEEGRPGIVQRSFILPPQSRMGAITQEERRQAIHNSVMSSKYDVAIDRDSAYEMLEREKKQEDARKAKEQEAEKVSKNKNKANSKASGGRRKKSAIEKMTDSAINTIGREMGRKIIRGLFNNLKF